MFVNGICRSTSALYTMALAYFDAPQQLPLITSPSVSSSAIPIAFVASSTPSPLPSSSLVTLPDSSKIQLNDPYIEVPVSNLEQEDSYSGDAADESWQDGHIPSYVLTYAPYVHLYSGESFWPGDIAEHLKHTQPFRSFSPLSPAPTTRQNLSSLSSLNQYDEIYLTSDDDPESRPAWLGNSSNTPRSLDNYSPAPAVLVTIKKPKGIVDAFWFFFYSFNLGNTVFNIRFGNHVGDWEHTLVRFKHGKPTEVFFSEHSWGQAYSYKAVEKINKRPVAYSASGSHAMYGTPGTHEYVLPLGLLHDTTDRGPLWDPALNSYMYTYDLDSKRLYPANNSSKSSFLNGSSNVSPANEPCIDVEEANETSWFHFRGCWGDKRYPLIDSRQYMFAGQWHYDSGPTGPLFKHLARTAVCQSGEAKDCVVKHWLPPEGFESCGPWRGPDTDINLESNLTTIYGNLDS